MFMSTSMSMSAPRARSAFVGRAAVLLTSLLTSGLFGLPGCGESPPSPSLEPGLKSGCNPLGGGPDEDCFTPFPSSYYLANDGNGVPRVAIPAGVLPTSLRGMALDPTPINGRDGFSAATPIIVYFPDTTTRIDSTLLPSFASPGDSLLPSSTVQIFEYATFARVPLMAELDANVGDGDRQALIIYPQLRLRPATRYVVAISGLRTTTGQPVPPLSGFASLRDSQLDPGSVRAGLKPHFDEIFAMLGQQGLPRQSLQLAWDFTTQSDEPLYGRLIGMRDRAFSYQPTGAQPPPPPVQITTVNEMPSPHLLREIIGTYSVPSSLTDDQNGRLMPGPDGEPQIRGYGQFPLVIHIPACVQSAPGPVPVMIYGHGLFGGALDEMNSEYQLEIIDRLCMVQVGTDWIGLSAADETYVIDNVLTNFNNIIQLTDRLQQAHVNFAYLSHLIAGGGFDMLKQLQVNSQLSIDKSRIYYYGISNGGIQGLTALTLSPHFARGALCVPGGFWSRMMWRSADFSEFALLLSAAYPDPLDRQVLTALSQPLWDYTDPNTFAPHVLKDPLPGAGGTKQVLYQEGLGDAQVPNLTTRAMARTMGLPLLNQPIESVFGIDPVSAPADSAYVQYDIGQMPRPGATNVPPMDNPVHEAIRRLEAAKAQLQAFLTEGGQVIDSCNAMPCLFPPP